MSAFDGMDVVEFRAAAMADVRDMSHEFEVVDGYDRSKHRAVNTYRWARREDIPTHGEIEFLSVQSTARRARLSGAVRTWKRDANRIEFPIKYGMYESTTFRLLDDGRVGNDVAYMIVRVHDGPMNG